ncbi:MAG TPA: alpha/beta fold hydrolase [Gemmatimonadaceae bacterium]|nr:alpha/beta fold hydrolase [Gemmatimonadaceae bacterium]
MKRFARIVGWIVVLLLLIAAGFYVSRDLERQTLDATARASAPGKFVQLRDGITHYDLSGPDSSRTVVLLSGFSVPFYIWEPTRDALAANGFRVLRYDYFGRGYSDRPKLRYDLATYDQQLTELLDSLGVRGLVDVAGLSMGGAIAANFADRHPDRVRTLTLVDPGIGVFAETPFPFSVPVLGEFALTVTASQTAKGQLTDFLHPERYPDWVKRYEPQMRYKGFRRAMIRTMRGDVFKRPVNSFTTLAQGQIPILLIWGNEDRTVPFAMSDSVRAAFPRAEFHAIDGAAHLPHIEQPALVDSVLLRFLRGR